VEREGVAVAVHEGVDRLLEERQHWRHVLLRSLPRRGKPRERKEKGEGKAAKERKEKAKQPRRGRRRETAKQPRRGKQSS
jgi:hypothetical protein